MDASRIHFRCGTAGTPEPRFSVEQSGQDKLALGGLGICSQLCCRQWFNYDHFLPPFCALLPPMRQQQRIQVPDGAQAAAGLMTVPLALSETAGCRMDVPVFGPWPCPLPPKSLLWEEVLSTHHQHNGPVHSFSGMLWGPAWESLGVSVCLCSTPNRPVRSPGLFSARPQEGFPQA